MDLLIFWRVLVEEQLVGEGLRRGAPRMRQIAAGQSHAVDQVLAGHFVIDAERVPAHRPVGLPLQLAVAALHRGFEAFAGVGVAPGHGAGAGVPALHRHLHDDAGVRVDGQDGRIGGAALGAEGGQDDLDHLVVAFQHAHQGGVEAAGGVVLGGGGELVLEAEGVQEGAQPGVVVGAEASRGCRTGRGCGSAACRDAAPASPCSARCRAPCAARPCRR